MTHLDLNVKTMSSTVTTITREKKGEEQEEKFTCKKQADRLKTGLVQQPYRPRLPASKQFEHKKNYYVLPRLFHSLEISFFFKSMFLTTEPGLIILAQCMQFIKNLKKG